VTRKSRINLALTLMGIGIVLNIIVLFSDDTSPGGIAAVVLLGAAGVALLTERRQL
jgi:hypothetical protein